MSIDCTQMVNARKFIDIGLFTGYLALAVALALPEDGMITFLDTNVELPFAKLA